MFRDGIQVRHLNGDPKDNSWDNIAIGTQSDNMMDIPIEERVRKAKLASSKIRRFTDEQVAMIRSDRAAGMTYSKLCQKYDTSKGTLSYMFNEAQY